MVAAKDLVMVPQGRHAGATGRSIARWLLLCATLLAMSGGVPRAAVDEASVSVTEKLGVYTVTAAFAVTESPQTVIAVLTDYDRIPTFMPDVEVSRVIERTPAGLVVEQKAVSRFLLFSKSVHLLLDVQEHGLAIRFRDRCGKSFASYHGGWTISQHDSLTVVDYQLSAKPSFEVPAFVLKRLLKRDSALLIDRLKAEIASRENRRR
jgi:ribosome-associated toxin RatA of RatAB toxin-antitoxin module